MEFVEASANHAARLFGSLAVYGVKETGTECYSGNRVDETCI